MAQNPHNLEDLKEHLLSVIVAVLAVFFLREAVARRPAPTVAIALAIMIGILTIFLAKKLFEKR